MTCSPRKQDIPRTEGVPVYGYPAGSKWPDWQKKHVLMGTASDEDVDDEGDNDDERPIDRRIRDNVPPFVYHFVDQVGGTHDGHGVVHEVVDTYAKGDIFATDDVPAVARPSHGIHGPGHAVVYLTGVDDNDSDSDNEEVDCSNNNEEMKGKGKGRGSRQRGKLLTSRATIIRRLLCCLIVI